MTNITMQADGDGEAECHVCAIDQSSGQLYAEGESSSHAFEGVRTRIRSPAQVECYAVVSHRKNSSSMNMFFGLMRHDRKPRRCRSWNQN